MQKLSRRQLARYAVDSLAGGKTRTEVARQLAASLLASRKTGQVHQLMSDIAYELEDKKLSANATVTSAAPLSRELMQEVEKFITAKTGSKELVVDKKIDASVIGGIRIETSKHGWDETIKRRLTDIREAF